MLVLGLTSLCLTACAAPSSRPSGLNTAPLALCYTQPVPSAGETNGSLAQGFLEAREALQVCQGVARSVDGEAQE